MATGIAVNGQLIILYGPDGTTGLLMTPTAAAPTSGNGAAGALAMNVQGGYGQDTTSTTNGQHGGTGGNAVFTGGTGGAATGASGSVSGGAGGQGAIQGGTGGDAANSTTGTGGAGGPAAFNGGAGGTGKTGGLGGGGSMLGGIGGTTTFSSGTGGQGGPSVVQGGTGGPGNGGSSRTAGQGGHAWLRGGNGGTVDNAGSARGSGGNAYVLPGAAATGPGTGGAAGHVTMCHDGSSAVGNVGIGNDAPNAAYALDVTGRVNTTSGYNGIGIADLPQTVVPSAASGGGGATTTSSTNAALTSASLAITTDGDTSAVEIEGVLLVNMNTAAKRAGMSIVWDDGTFSQEARFTAGAASVEQQLIAKLLITAPSAGAHTAKIYWRSVDGTATATSQNWAIFARKYQT